MRAWQIVSEGGIDALHLAEIEKTKPGPFDVQVRIRASSLNYRDLTTVKDPAGRGLPYPRIPNSDAAGEVVAVGERVTRFAVGDRVATCFFRDWEDGACSPEAMATALGGALDGVLAEGVTLPEHGLVPLPTHLDFAEGATLPCAALTAWHALMEVGRIKAGDTVLLLGTGGVSIFALQFAVLAGARAIVISKDDTKLDRVRAMGAWATVNYARIPDWDREIVRLTEGRGVDLTVEVGGAGTLERSVQATRVAGAIALIGVLTGGVINPTPIMRKSIRLQGVYVGSRRMFLDMNRAITAHGLRPVIHEHVGFTDAKAAFHAMEAARHLGKIVIDVR